MGIGFSLLDFPSISYIYSLAVFVPSLAVGVRRLHDMGKSGWFLLIGLIPIVGWILLIIWLCTDSEPASNEWGANPKEVGGDVVEHLIDDDSLV